jgi:hypothetical protein
MKNIKVNKEELRGNLNSTIIKKLNELNILSPSNSYDLKFFRKNNRSNGKQFIIITDVNTEEIKGWWIKDNIQYYTLISIEEETIWKLLYAVYWK